MMTANAEMVFDAQRVRTLLGMCKTSKIREAPPPQRPDEWIVYLPASVMDLPSLGKTKAPLHEEQKKLYALLEDPEYSMKVRPGYWGIVMPVPQSEGKLLGERGIQRNMYFPMHRSTPLILDALLLSLALLATGKEIVSRLWVLPYYSLGRGPISLYYSEGRIRFSINAMDDEKILGSPSSLARWICP